MSIFRGNIKFVPDLTDKETLQTIKHIFNSLEGFDKYINQSGQNYSLSSELKDAILGKDRNKNINEIIDNIRKFSSIYADTIDQIIKHPEENTFVYNKY